MLDLYCGNRESVTYFLCSNQEEEKSNVTQVAEEEVKESSTEYHKNLTDFVNVMSQRLEPPASVEKLGLCDYYNNVIITVIITTFANSILFLFILTFCMRSSRSQDYK